MESFNPYRMSVLDAVGYAEEEKFVVVKATDLKALCQHWQEQYNILQAELDAYKQRNMLTIDETIEKLHVSKATLWRWNRQGFLTNTKVGKRVLYKSEDINNIINNKYNKED